VARLRFGRKAKIVLATFVATALAVLLIANLALGDKRIDRQVRTLYALEAPQFRRVMEVMLGPAMLPGNRVQALVNGPSPSRPTSITRAASAPSSAARSPSARAPA
jgi:hypothetical protein